MTIRKFTGYWLTINRLITTFNKFKMAHVKCGTPSPISACIFLYFLDFQKHLSHIASATLTLLDFCLPVLPAPASTS
jgi:hypothetical protein